MDRPNKQGSGGANTWLLDFVLVSAVWGSSFMFMRLAVIDFGTLPTAALRAGIGTLALLPLLFLRRQVAEVRRSWKPLLTAGVLNAAIPSAGLSFALLSISSGMTSIVNATVPLFGALVAFIWFGNKPSRLAVIGLCIGFTGVALLAWDKATVMSGTESWSAVLAMLAASAAALSGAISAMYAKRHLSHVPPLAIATGSQMGATIALALPAFLLWPKTPAGLTAWLGAAAAGVLCTGLGYLLFFRLLERAGPTRALTVTFLMPLFAMCYGVMFLNEEVTLAMQVCAVAIIGGTALSMGFLSPKGGP